MRLSLSLARTTVLVTALATSFISCGETDSTDEQGAVDLTGVWGGEWLSPGVGEGRVTVTLAQTGSYISGEMQIEGNICSPDSVIEGFFDPEELAVELTLKDLNNDDHQVTMEGSYQEITDTITVSFEVVNWEICTGGVGSMTFTRY